MRLNRDFIGRDFGSAAHLVTQGEITKYARAIGGQENSAYRSGVAPPSFPVIYELPFLEKIWSDPELNGGREQAKRNVLMLVHGEQRMIFHRPLTAGMEISFSANLEKIEDKGSGEVLAFSTESRSGGEAVCRSQWGLFIRGIGSGKKSSASAKPKPSAPKTHETSPPETVFKSVIEIPADITPRYADASGDRNPIHLDENAARQAGLKGVVVHGLCTMSMVMQRIIDGYLGGDPAKLKQLAVRFSAPVYPGDTLAVQVFDASSEGKSAVKFEASAGGIKVIKGGYAEFE